MTATLFDSITPPDAVGCRLQRIELYNWGTFHQKVWTFDLDGRNALLTGDIGSGKSTIVDAVTTLLLPSHRISYNKAAGAETRERDLRSYVLGHWKSERVETTGTTRPVALRTPANYSVILGVFASGPGRVATLAQVFRAREDNSQPERFFVVADTDLSIEKHFSDVGDTLANLKRRLREQGATTYDAFPDYGRDFRRKLGIDSEQALDLFHQTVSMKAVDNLNDFVRLHMLEPFDMTERIASLVDHFDDLTRAHEAVLRARQQLDLLAPLVDGLDRHDELTAELGILEARRDALDLYVAQHAHRLLAAESDRLAAELAVVEQQLRDAASRRGELHDRQTRINLDIAGHGGHRLAELDADIARLDVEWPQRQQRLKNFNALLAGVGLGTVAEHGQFVDVHRQLADRDAAIDVDRTAVADSLRSEQLAEQQVIDEGAAVNAELHSLANRANNLPSASLVQRTKLCDDLGLDTDELPFAGELIQVSDDAREWEGATERVLRGFALSLLVPDQHYERIARWIDEHHLGTRLVYFRVPARTAPADLRRTTTHPLLLDMVDVRADSAFEPWIRNELQRRADHACVGTISELRVEAKAVTRDGTVKSRDRHEKDDRHLIGDRREYVLGWSNQAKVDALVEEAQRLAGALAPITDRIEVLRTQQRTLDDTRRDLGIIANQDRWDDLDWQSVVRTIDGYRTEADTIRRSSDVLASLTSELDLVAALLTDADVAIGAANSARGGLVNQQEGVAVRTSKVESVLRGADIAALQPVFDELDRWLPEPVRRQLDQFDSTADAQRAASELIATERERVTNAQHTIETRVVKAMQGFRHAYPQEVSELDDSLDSGDEYRELHRRVADDDLPRFQDEFKRLLNENAIREVAMLSAQLNEQEHTIRKRIERINESLRSIDYNPDRYIHLVPEATPNTEIRGFREDLRACTSNIVSADDQYSEQRFLQVKEIIDRFKGRDGSTDQDRTWTRRVTDVRQWFVFSASERWRADDREHESYADSAGKSGGQKEKLAYTILAASLAYQFKLDEERNDAFRFVVIDEAFGRGSDDSTRYALSLFTNLGLQLLIVTPLQKIHVIEPHVSCVGFVDNLDGNYSRLQRLTIEEHRRRRLEPATTNDE